MDPELRSVIARYTFVGIVLAGAVVWAGIYTTQNATPRPQLARLAGTPATDSSAGPPAQTDGNAAPARAPALSSLLVTKDGVQRVACEPACRLEAYCGFRDVAVCLARSCDAARDVRMPSSSDFAFARADTCTAAAAAPCQEACWRRGECAGDHSDDVRCTDACLAVARDRPPQAFVESRCVLESSCQDLTLCTRRAP